MPAQVFRAGVVIVVRHPDGQRVMAFERADLPGAWQLPQGGLNVGEEPIEGAWRELAEETGLGAGEVVARAEYPQWVAYEWPDDIRTEHGRDGKRRGQVQKWFLFDAVSVEVEPAPDGSEFVDWKWVTTDWLIEQVPEFRRHAYRQVLSDL